MEIMLTLLSLQVRYSMRILKYENWVQGSKYVVNDINNKDIRGEYDLTIADKSTNG
jgi:predicted transcriptional regulator